MSHELARAIVRGAADPADRMEALGCAGFVVSVCCGPSGLAPCRWSVQVLSPQGLEFERPFTAVSFAQAIAIASVEIERRGWWPDVVD